MGTRWRSDTPPGRAQPDRQRNRTLSPWSYLLFTGWATLAALLAEDGELACLAVLEIAFCLAWSPGGLGLLRRTQLWVFILTTMALGPLLIGEPDTMLGPVGMSREGLTVGLSMAARAFAVTMALNAGLAVLSISDIVAVSDRLGLRGLGFATALAVNMVGVLRAMALTTLQTIWLRGGMQRPWTALRLFLITVVTNALRYRDDLVKAAAVRAFDPRGGNPESVPLRPADLWLLVFLAASTGALLAAHNG